jgi:hypothetical protein
VSADCGEPKAENSREQVIGNQNQEDKTSNNEKDVHLTRIDTIHTTRVSTK